MSDNHPANRAIALRQVMREIYDELIAFVTSPEFKAVVAELRTLDPRECQRFITSVLLDRDELVRRGVHVPAGILIQRSAFGDRRPTLFVVKKFLPAEHSDVWQNVNITFDQPFPDASVARTPEISWRKPLPIDVQAEALATGQNLEDVRA